MVAASYCLYQALWMGSEFEVTVTVTKTERDIHELCKLATLAYRGSVKLPRSVRESLVLSQVP
jgi:hypothetical protein